MKENLYTTKIICKVILNLLCEIIVNICFTFSVRKFKLGVQVTVPKIS